METLTATEQEAISKLFNYGGYVLDFSTDKFNAFTYKSIGIPLCVNYDLSKGKSLERFFSDASIIDAVQLLKDLLDYYTKLYQGPQKKDGWENDIPYKECLKIIKKHETENPFIENSMQTLIEKFNRVYINQLITDMIKTQKNNPTDSIGKAKELIESCCKAILGETYIPIDDKWNMHDLINNTIKALEISPKDIGEDIKSYKIIKPIIGSLRSIAFGIVELRNSYGSGHGKDPNFEELEERYARLAVGSVVTLVNFLLDSYELQKETGKYFTLPF